MAVVLVVVILTQLAEEAALVLLVLMAPVLNQALAVLEQHLLLLAHQ
jgi:hypothetical protein